MRLLITGTPGCGKTTLAKHIGEKLGLIVINEKDFALKNKLGRFNDANELEIPLKEFEKKANIFLNKKDNVLFEGHTLCEMRLRVDKVILISINPEVLEQRLQKRGYSIDKIMDNVFCEGIEYSKKHLLRNYPKTKIIFVSSNQNQKLTLIQAIKGLNLN